MLSRRSLVYILTCLLVLSSSLAGAQERRKSGSFGVSKADYERMLNGGARNDPNARVVDKTRYEDASLDDLGKKIDDRDWSSEATAWERACKENTKEAYQRYATMYANGPHVAQARTKLVDLGVNDIFKSPYNAFPELKRVEKDDNSKTCTVTIENMTQYPMTVMFSGPGSKSIVIGPRSKATVTIDTGLYRVAASVPRPDVRPFAGTQQFYGGRYETGFTIVYR